MSTIFRRTTAAFANGLQMPLRRCGLGDSISNILCPSAMGKEKIHISCRKNNDVCVRWSK